MKRRILMPAALMLALAGPALAQDPENPAAPAISTSASQTFPQVTCSSADPLAINAVLQLAADTRDSLAPLLRLGPNWRFPVHIRVMTPEDPLLARVNHEAAAVFAQGDTMRIEAAVPSTDPDAREFIQRQFVTVLLWEKFFSGTTTFDRKTRLDVVPTWLSEGLREKVTEDPEHNRESIVRRAVAKQSTPTLDEVIAWHSISDDRLLGMWQRAFCYYLVKSLTSTPEKLDDFQQWLAGSSGTIPTSPFHFPTDAQWQRELIDASSQTQGLVYTWEETRDKLTDAANITYAESKKEKVQKCALDDALSLPRTPAVLQALRERNFLLTSIELRAHPGFRSSLELYRAALSAIDANHLDDARKDLADARHQLNTEVDNHQKLLDYVNWFEVTKDYPDNNSRFQRYFSTARSMQRAEADTAHPNPIRANLLEIEAHL